MEEEIRKYYEEVKDKISEEQFLSEVDAYMEDNKDNPFMTKSSAAEMVVNEYVDNKNEILSETEEYAKDKISKLEPTRGINITGTVMSISNIKSFKTRKGDPGKLCNVELADDTGSIRVTFWTRSISLIKNFKEGDIIRVNNVDIKDGYTGLEAQTGNRSTVNKLNREDFPEFPVYKEEITNISDINATDDNVNIIARIIKIPPVRTYESNGREGEVTSLELQDATEEISYTLWNKDVELIDKLELQSGDTIKILGAQVRERNDEISLSNGKIEKGEYDLPEYVEVITPIGDIKEQKNITILGVVSRLYDIRKFQRSDGSEGQLKSFLVKDQTGEIRVTVWGDVANIEINKGDIVKISGANARFDDYTESGYSLNTNWNTEIKFNPKITSEEQEIFEELKEGLGPIPLDQIELLDDDGIEVDVMGRILTVNDINEFERDDGTTGIVRSVILGDELGFVTVSFWDDKANQEFVVGDPYRIENARTRLGMNSVDLNVGGSARVIKLTEEEAYTLPAAETLEQLIYEKMNIADLDEEDEFKIVVARVFEINDIREFERMDGGKGKVRNIEIADHSGTIRVTLWDKDAEREFEVGEAIKIQNPRIVFNNDHLEISIARNSSIATPSDSEIEALPTYDELKEDIYQEKTIEMLEDNDTNIHLTGQIMEPLGDRIIQARCPNCNNVIEDIDEGDEYTCDYCGEDIEEPNYLLMIPAKLEDDTGEIPVVFYNKLAEELLEMEKDQIIEILKDSVDLGAIEGKVDSLEGLTVELIANVSFNEFNEEMRINPKRILSKSY